jgi:hypothetical protein
VSLLFCVNYLNSEFCSHINDICEFSHLHICSSVQHKSVAASLVCYILVTNIYHSLHTSIVCIILSQKLVHWLMSPFLFVLAYKWHQLVFSDLQNHVKHPWRICLQLESELILSVTTVPPRIEKLISQRKFTSIPNMKKVWEYLRSIACDVTSFW